MNTLSGYYIKKSRSPKKMLLFLSAALPIILWIVNLFS